MKHIGPAKPEAQHAPVGVGWGQASLLHTVPAPRHAPLHCACVVTVHVAAPGGLLIRQHAPVAGGGVHRLAVHTVLFPW